MITIERKKLEQVLEALTYKKWFRIGMVEQNDPRVEAAITAIKEALAQPAQEWSWVCNECGSSEFTSALSEADLEYLACSGCGGNEFHKEALAPTSTQCEKQPAQKPNKISTEELIYMTGVHDGKVLEREACAKVCDAFQAREVGMQPAECAGAIRARGNT